jgi:hypothetical protein
MNEAGGEVNLLDGNAVHLLDGGIPPRKKNLLEKRLMSFQKEKARTKRIPAVMMMKQQKVKANVPT